MRARLLGLAALACLTACEGSTVPLPGTGDASSETARLYTCVVAHVLHDFPSLTQKEWSKVEVFFDPGSRAIAPSDVSRAYFDGPSGFHLEIANVPFVAPVVNGYVQNDELGGLWYQAIVPGFLPEGRYVVTLAWTDGRVETCSRTLRAERGLLEFYRTHAHDLEYSPVGSSPANDTVLSWTTLAELGGPDAYYNAWISRGTTESIDPVTARGDSIFSDAIDDPSAGRNADHSRMGSADRPLAKGAQTWHPEILDSNVLDEVDLIIFPPAQHFDAR